MQVTVEDKSSVKKILHIEIPQAEITSEIAKGYANINKNAKIKGFRKGKVPKSVLIRMFKKDVYSEVTSKVIQKSFIEALTETKLPIIGTPKMDPPDLNEDEPYKYDAVIEISPELSGFNIDGFKLKKNLYKVTDEQIDIQLKALQDKFASFESIKEKHPVQNDDIAVIDFEASQDGKEFKGIEKKDDFSIKIGAGVISTEFDSQLIGTNIGETKEFPVLFPEDYVNKDLGGQTITFKVTLKDLKEKIIPEIDDVFAKSLGEYETLEKLKEQITENLKQGYEKRIDQELNEQIFESLISQQDFEIPDVMTQYEQNSIMGETEKALTANNMTFEQLGKDRKSFEETAKQTAVNQVRRQLILKKLIEQETLELTKAELDEGVKQLASEYNKPYDNFKLEFEQNKDTKEYFKQTLLEKKILKLILNKCEIIEIEPEKDATVSSEEGSE